MAYLPYTKYPRPCMWLVRGDYFTAGGGLSGEPEFDADVGSFYISRSCIANEAYQAFRPEFQPASISPGPEDPAVGLSFRDAVAYCEWWSEVSHKHFRLPTEMEWELACGGGRKTRFPWGDSSASFADYAFTRENSPERCPAFEELAPNEQGVFGMIGGVWEWTSSQFASFPIPEDGERERLDVVADRVLRGGSFLDSIEQLATRIRRAESESYSGTDVGFRIVRSL